MDFDKKVLGERIKKRREYCEILQIDLAASCGITASQISHIEHVRKLPSLPIIAVIASILHTSVDFLIKNAIPDIENGL